MWDIPNLSLAVTEGKGTMGTKKNKQSDSVLCSFLALKKTRPKISTRNLDPMLAGDELNRGPIFRIGHNLISEPITDELLAKRGSLHKIRNLGSEGGLTASGSNELFQGDDVRFIHEPHSTNILVDVNKNSDSIIDKGFCNVLDMETARKRQADTKAKPPRKAKKTKRVLEVGPDRLTMPERLRSLMLDHKPPFVPERGGQSQLARVAQAIYANGRENAPATIKQAHIWEMLNGQDSSRYLPVVAKVFGVNCLWLQFGIGEKRTH